MQHRPQLQLINLYSMYPLQLERELSCLIAKLLNSFLYLVSVANCGQGNKSLHHLASSMTTMHDECLTQPPQLELVGHSIVSAFVPQACFPNCTIK